MPSRLGLQTKIIIIVASSVIFLLGASTIVAMILTRQPVEEEVYRKALVQARLTAHNLINDQALQNPKELVRILFQMQHDVPGVKQADVFSHVPSHSLLARDRKSVV